MYLKAILTIIGIFLAVIALKMPSNRAGAFDQCGATHDTACYVFVIDQPIEVQQR